MRHRAFPAVFDQSRSWPERLSHRGLFGGALHGSTAGPACRRAVRMPRLQAAIGVVIADRARRRRPLAHAAAAAVTVMALVGSACDARRRPSGMPSSIPPDLAQRGARTGRHRLRENPVDFRGGADVGRRRHVRLHGPARARRRAVPQLWRGCGSARPRFDLKAWRFCDRDPPGVAATCSTTTS